MSMTSRHIEQRLRTIKTAPPEPVTYVDPYWSALAALPWFYRCDPLVLFGVVFIVVFASIYLFNVIMLP